jgi:hypothetical protein
MWEDPIVAEVRRIREELAARFNFDVKAIFADMRKRQAALGAMLVSREKQAEPAGTVGQEPPSNSSAPSDSVAPVPATDPGPLTTDH